MEGAKLVYAAAKKKNGEFIFPGKEPGSELVWTQLNPAKAPIPLILGTFQVATYQDANWDWHNYDLDRDVAAADEKFGYVNAPYDLSAFKSARRQAAALSRLERHRDFAGKHHQLLPERLAEDGLRSRIAGCASTWFRA